MRQLMAAVLVVYFVSADLAVSQQPKAASPPVDVPVASAHADPPPANTLLDGTAVKLRLSENLTSATAKAGQSIPFEVLEEVNVQGVPVIAKGAQALGTVTLAESKKSMGRAGKLDVNIDSVRLMDGEKAALSATRNEKGGGHTGAMTAGIVATAIVFFPAAPLLLFIHGKDITIPKGTEITAFVAGDMKLDPAKFAPVPASGNAVVASAPASGLMVDANVANCDIEVDGSFVGNTPSTLTLTPGKHEVMVKKSGYQDWTRNMMVGTGSVRVNAEMVAK